MILRESFIFKTKTNNEIIIINLIFVTKNVFQSLIKCELIKKLNFDFDHEAIVIKFKRETF